jgi:hypothetical protein
MPATPAAPRSFPRGRRRVANPRWFCALVLLLAAAGVAAQSLQTLSVDFVRRSGSEQAPEEVRGTLYFQAPERVLIRVSQPTLQWSEFAGRNLLIYYPEERRAFRFISRNRLLIPFARSFLGFLRPDFGLADAGFSLKQSRKRGDLLVTVWEPPRALRGYVSQALVGTDRGGPVFLELEDREGRMVSRTEYTAPSTVGGLTFPGRIVVVQRSEGDETREESFYTNHQVNLPLPSEATDFRLPEDVPVQELQW